MKLHFCFGILLTFLFGCSHIEKKKFSRTELKAVWIKNLNQKVNNAARASHSFFTIPYKNILLQGNSVDGISALDERTGNLKWFFKVVGGVEAPGVIDLSDEKKPILFFGGNDGFFYALDILNGNALWTYPVKMEVLAEPILDQNNVYFLSGNNVVFSLDKKTGQQKWIYARSETQPISLRGGSKPSLTNEAVIVGMADGALVSLDKNSGNLRWEKQLNSSRKIRDIDSNILVDKEFLYVMSYGGVLANVRQLTGDLVWKNEKLGGPGKIILQKDELLFSSFDGELLALNKEDQKKRIIYKFKNSVGSTPLMVSDEEVLIADSNGKVHLISIKTGQDIATYEAGTSIFAQPVYNSEDQSVYVVTSEANLHKIKISRGLE